jgi:methylated-DNA-[protein]-cysteine S-methyltransferase
MRTTYDSPIGPLTLIGDDDGALTGVCFAHEHRDGDEPDALTGARDPLPGARHAFARYFDGDPHAFAGLRLRFAGSPLQRAVWNALLELPFGATTTYGELARRLRGRLGATTSPRAVGSANARTPIPIVMACHRVVGADGALTGYRGGLDVKRALLAFEASGGDRSALEGALRAG